MQEFQSIASVIIVVLAVIFLVFGIVIVVMVFNILRNIRRIIQRVDETSENVGELIKYMGKKTAPGAMSAIGKFMWRRAKSKVKKGDDDE